MRCICSSVRPCTVLAVTPIQQYHTLGWCASSAASCAKPPCQKLVPEHVAHVLVRVHTRAGVTGIRVARKTRGEFYSGFYQVRLLEGFLSGGFFPMSGQKLYEASLTYRGSYHIEASHFHSASVMGATGRLGPRGILDLNTRVVGRLG
jgi:hypothetical protein